MSVAEERPVDLSVKATATRCSLCGKTDAWPFLRAPLRWRPVNAGSCCSDDCERLQLARDAEQMPDALWLDRGWRFEPLRPVDWMRIVEPWWGVCDAGHVILEMDPYAGIGWWLIRRGEGKAGPFATWEEAVRA